MRVTLDQLEEKYRDSADLNLSRFGAAPLIA